MKFCNVVSEDINNPNSNILATEMVCLVSNGKMCLIFDEIKPNTYLYANLPTIIIVRKLRNQFIYIFLALVFSLLDKKNEIQRNWMICNTSFDTHSIYLHRMVKLHGHETSG